MRGIIAEQEFVAATFRWPHFRRPGRCAAASGEAPCCDCTTCRPPEGGRYSGRYKPSRARSGIDARDYGQEATSKWKNILPSLLVQRFEKRQTEAPEQGTKQNVTDGPVSPALLGSTFTWLRVGTDLLSQSLR